MKLILNRRITSFFLCCVMCILAIVPMTMTAHASSTAITGVSTIAQTVYTGPHTGHYVSAGSISAGETVYILGAAKNTGWYHIQYHVGNTGKQKSGYVPAFTLTNVTGTVSDEIYNGGLRKSTKSYDVFSCDDSAIAMDIGGISANETFSLLYAYQYVDSSKSYLCAYIEYSTSSGAKRGYVYYPEFISDTAGTNGVTSIARMKNSATVYYGEDTSSYAAAGSISSGEFVSVICKKSDWVYVEYNTNSGRKRGYISSGYLDYHVSGLYYRDTYGLDGYTQPSVYAATTLTIYAGPSSTYAITDTIPENTEIGMVRTFVQDPSWSYITYATSSGKWRSGWIYG